MAVGTATTGLQTRVLNYSAAAGAAGWNETPSPASTGAAAPLDRVDLSPQARAALQAEAGQQILREMSTSFDDLVAQKTSQVAEKLVSAFTAEGIPLDEPLSLRVDDAGTIRADGPYKEKIEKLFKDNPELAEDLRTAATLNALKAAQEVYRLQNDELRSARSDEEREAARNRQMLRSMDIQTIGGLMTLKDGELTSAAVDYATRLAEKAEGKPVLSEKAESAA